VPFISVYFLRPLKASVTRTSTFRLEIHSRPAAYIVSVNTGCST